MIMESGLTEIESLVVDRLVDAWNNALFVGDMTDSELSELRDCIDGALSLFAYRIVKRDYPGFWR